MKIWRLCLLLGLLSSYALADSTISIIGRVVDYRNNPVNGVYVQAPGFRGVETNSKGEFNLAGHPPRTSSLLVTFSGLRLGTVKRTYKATTRVEGGGTTVVVWPRVIREEHPVIIGARTFR